MNALSRLSMVAKVGSGEQSDYEGIASSILSTERFTLIKVWQMIKVLRLVCTTLHAQTLQLTAGSHFAPPDGELRQSIFTYILIFPQGTL